MANSNLKYVEVWPDTAVSVTTTPAFIPFPDLVEPKVFDTVTSYSPVAPLGMLDTFISDLQPGKSVKIGPVSVPSMWVVLGLFAGLIYFTKK